MPRGFTISEFGVGENCKPSPFLRLSQARQRASALVAAPARQNAFARRNSLVLSATYVSAPRQWLSLMAGSIVSSAARAGLNRSEMT
jgi:hypothetical protein